MSSTIPIGASTMGGITDPGGLFPTFVPSDVASEMVLGCPISSFMSLDSRCPITGTGVPACAQTGPFDGGCCAALSSFATSVGDCYSSNAPACLNLDELSSSLTAFSATATDDQTTNPCDRFASATGTGTNTAAGLPTETGTVSTEGKTSATGKTTSATGTATHSASGTATSTSNSGSGRAKERNSMGLKMVVGLAMVGGLSVLWL
ncbi:hypothetical protein NHQ30_007799 [Ciborinia camelliae]|nr:hypothetical protein NHQ30_007799 [Ciborinia camelliae]